ncbi:MAG: tRNA (N(6)-L-threonylcarbamoyladenosine(37)-C(2))-methylthiotransferase MtaB [Campylobacteraceae bacterium]|nr:tRNA (N(6)-L-threonylcarbamoyladenosine(37)-C(2))-methylthiotransferase MtaB [Campylobacteraceae bacterium]
MSKKVYFKTFGCRTNIYDTEIMKNSIESYEICEDESSADIIVVNSCTVTNGADSDVRNYLNRANRSGKKVFLTGCGAISKGEELFKENKAFGVFGMGEKLKIDEFLKRDDKFIELGNLDSIEKGSVVSFSSHTKAFLKIQEGCNFNCSYCIIPSVRGKARSKDENALLEEATHLAENGFSEIVLTGTNIGSYGRDKDTSLAKLLKKLSQIKGIKRVRLGSLEPSQIDSEFRELLDEEWLERHLHIALQHTSQKMLTIMRRRNNAFRDLELFNYLANKGFALGTDFIVGHPGESSEIWTEAMQNFKKFPLTHIHAFIYSPRDGTHSAAMKMDVNGKVAKERLKFIKNIVDINNFNFRKKRYNESLKVLVEQEIDGHYTGFDQFYNGVFIKSDESLVNRWIEVGKYEVTKAGNFAKI